MKPSSRDYPLGLASPLNYAAIQSGNIKNPSNKEAGLDVSHHTLVSREGRRENFFLDILFNRMSEMWAAAQGRVFSTSVAGFFRSLRRAMNRSQTAATIAIGVSRLSHWAGCLMT